MGSRPRSYWVLVVPLLLALIAPLLTAQVIVEYGVNVPVRDQWRFAPEVVAYFQGNCDLATIFQPFGPHRIALPKAIMLTLAGLTDWDTRAEMWFNFATVVLGLALLTDLARVTLRPQTGRLWAWVVPLMSASLFTMGAWQSWTFGWMMNLYLGVLGAIVSAWGIGRFGNTLKGSVVSLGGATLAAYSYLGALPLLVLVPLALTLLPREPGRGLGLVAATVIVALVLIALYFVDYPATTATGQFSLEDLHPGSILVWVLHYLGARLAAGQVIAAMAWGIVAAGLGALAVVGCLRSREHRAALLPWLLLLSYVVTAGALTAVGRQVGPQGPFLSRFAMLPALYWAALPGATVLALVACGWARYPVGLRAAILSIALVAVILAAPGYRETWSAGVARTANRSANLGVARQCLQDLPAASNDCLRILSARNPQLVRRWARRMSRLSLGPFAESQEGTSP